MWSKGRCGDGCPEPEPGAQEPACGGNYRPGADACVEVACLHYFKKNIPHLLEVSIGHALVSDALVYGMEKTIKKYLSELCS